MKRASYRKKELAFLKKLTDIQNQLLEIKNILEPEQKSTILKPHYKKIISAKEVEYLYSINLRTQANYRERRKYPLPYVKYKGSRNYFYKVEKLEEWIEREELDEKKF